MSKFLRGNFLHRVRCGGGGGEELKPRAVMTPLHSMSVSCADITLYVT